MEIEEDDERFLSSPRASTEFEERSRAIDLAESAEETIVEKEMEIPKETTLSLEQEVGPSLGEEIREEEGGEAERISEESFSLTLEPSEKVLESFSGSLEENGYQGWEESERAFGQETFQKLTPSISEEMGEEIEEEPALGELEPHADEEVGGESRLNASVFEEATQLLEDISESPREVEVEGKIEGREEEVVKEEVVKEERLPSFPWIEYFKDAVETYYQKPRDIFSIWFEECRKEGEFKNSFDALLTLLVHSRFDQGSQSIEALENTQKVFRLLVQPKIGRAHV